MATGYTTSQFSETVQINTTRNSNLAIKVNVAAIDA